MSDFPLTIDDAAKALRAGEITSVQLTETMIERANRLDGVIGCYIRRTDQSALDAAARADEQFESGVDLGPLQGIPLGIKDIISTDDAPTTAQSVVLDPGWGDRGDGPVMKRLRAAGAVITGKTTTMEFAIGLPDEAKPFPIPRNPWELSRWPGGSSSGTGNGIAAGLFFGGLGTDTGGSVRMPACFCGVSGMKQTFGLVPKSGCVPLGYSLDHIGPLARSARDCALMLNVMAGYDSSDLTSTKVSVPDYTATLDGTAKGLRVGVDRENHLTREGFEPEAAVAFESAVDALKAAGAEIVEVTVPHYSDLATVGTMTMAGEAGAYHMPDLRTRWDDYGRFTNQYLGLAALFSSADFVQAQRFRSYIRPVLLDFMADLDVIVMPTAGIEAPELATFQTLEFFKMPIFTPQWNPTGFPAMSIPMGFGPAGTPYGLQLVAKPFEEAAAFRLGDAFQQVTRFHLEIPKIAMTAAAV